MRATISPSSISGSLDANPSKSHAQRAIAIAALTKGTSELTFTGTSDDVIHATGIARSLGARIFQDKEILRITGRAENIGTSWNCGESGLSLRLFSAIAGLFSDPIELQATGSLLARPVGFMEDTFRQLGVGFESRNGLPPVTIHGPFRASSAQIDGSAGSQFLTGLLIALPLAGQDTTLHVRQLKSRPYIDLTIETLKEFGVSIRHDHYETFHIAGNQQYAPVAMRIQGDWSGMAFLFVAAAITGEITVHGLPPAEAQADGHIMSILKSCGADMHLNNNVVQVSRNGLNAFETDCTHCPDLFPPLVALAAHCDGTSIIHGVHRLSTKESDRSLALTTEFAKLGVIIEIRNDAMYVHGGKVRGGNTESHGDHRIAMALATAALCADDTIHIHGAECVAKSYPDFFQHLAQAGVVVTTQDH